MSRKGFWNSFGFFPLLIVQWRKVRPRGLKEFARVAQLFCGGLELMGNNIY